jgi:hypothetical protein
MSNHWDLRCLTCETDCDLGWNHGGDAIQELIPHLPALAAAGPVMEIIDRHNRDVVFPWMLQAFAEQHHAHKLIAVDEYGVVHGGCIHRYECGCCQTRLLCGLPCDHEGDHGPLPKDGAS